MIAQLIKERLSTEPFQPFKVRASSGRKYAVTNPDLVVMMKSSIFIAAPNSDRAATIPYLHIAAIEDGENGTGRNGRRKRRR
jgi:hypothetical protein